MPSIALGSVLLGVFATKVSFWPVLLLLLPTLFGTNAFNMVNNAMMSTLPTAHRGFPSGMLRIPEI